MRVIHNGQRTFYEGEVFDNIQEQVLCLDCLQTLTETEVRETWNARSATPPLEKDNMKTSIVFLESLIPVEHEDDLLDESIMAEAREKLSAWIKDPLHILDFAIQETIADEKPKYDAQEIVAASQMMAPDTQLALFPGIEPSPTLSIKEMATCDQPVYRVLKDPLGCVGNRIAGCHSWHKGYVDRIGGAESTSWQSCQAGTYRPI